MDYYQPDITWSVFGIKNQENFVKQFVIKARFHKAVHKDVVSSYKTVEYLMAHSYYHYPMFDEAKRKLSSIFEMAVKLRSEELGNSLSFKTKKGDIKEKTLGKLIDELKKNDYPESFIKKMHWARNVRNFDSHPNNFFFAGALLKNYFFSLINDINELFLPVLVLVSEDKQLEELKAKYALSLKGLYKLKYEENYILAYDPVLLKTWQKDNQWISAICFLPVLNNTKDFIASHNSLKPVLFFVTDLIFSDKGIEAIDSDTNKKLFFNKTDNLENINRFEKHLKEMNSSLVEDKQLFELSFDNDTAHLVEKAKYFSWSE